MLSAKNLKKWHFWPKWPFFDSFWPKKGKNWIFFKNLLGTFFYIAKSLIVKYQKKTNDKIWCYQRKTFKKWHFWPKWPFFDSFWPKMANFWIFFKNPLGTFFYTLKALSNCKVSEKTNERMSRYCVTYVHTYVQGST